jgi:hypothetical protein
LSELDTLNDVISGNVKPFGVVIPRTRSATGALDRVEVLHRRVRDLHADSADLRRQSLVSGLEERTESCAARPMEELLETVYDAGFAWRDVARIANVSVPAVQKWRRGDRSTGPNRYRVAKLVAFLDVLGDHFVTDCASWLEMPVKDGVEVSRLDLLAKNRFDLVLELISDDGDPVSAEDVLDEFEPRWRSAFVDATFETFLASDGVVSIRPKA